MEQFATAHDRLGAQESVREQMVNPPRQRIGRVVRPPIVHPQPGRQAKQRVGSGAIDLPFQRGADLLQREQILASEEVDDRADEHAARGVVRKRSDG